MTRQPPRSTLSSSSAASDVYKRQIAVQLKLKSLASIKDSKQLFISSSSISSPSKFISQFIPGISFKLFINTLNLCKSQIISQLVSVLSVKSQIICYSTITIYYYFEFFHLLATSWLNKKISQNFSLSNQQLLISVKLIDSNSVKRLKSQWKLLNTLISSKYFKGPSSQKLLYPFTIYLIAKASCGFFQANSKNNQLSKSQEIKLLYNVSIFFSIFRNFFS
eukprot:TRINITY_DN8554_c0_g1_i3.p3 TRINITY_DN8554_c0_g1~~TRINITY_DN8554_c0_g1_i3.p3  ORF type:complete len:221 (+),score=20.78 TRINITY_DN8554_c0_g1_i3:95-757(+)